MRKERRNSGAMVVIAILVIMTGAILTGVATEDVSGATKVDLYTSDITTSSVKLTWTETDDWLFDHYEVYMNDGSGWQLLKTYQSKYSLEYTVTGLESDTTYSFKIRDVDSLSEKDSDTMMITTEKEASIPALPITGILVAIILVALIVSVRRRKKAEET